jgi:hypothetical protein
MSEDHNKHWQVTLQDFLVSASMIGAGLGCAGLALRTNPPVPIWTLVLFLAAGPLLGAGLLALIGRWWLGAYLGFFAQIGIWFGWAYLHFGWEQMWR